MNYKILTGATNPILRAVADPIVHFDKDLIQLAKDMKRVCMDYDGVGLAAPQIGLSIRMIYTTNWKKTPKGLKYVGEQIMINPEILSHSETLNTDAEGCLSLPGLTGKVRRYDTIRVTYQDIDGTAVTRNYKGFDARIIQHEIDHINGVLFIDKAKDIRVSKG